MSIRIRIINGLTVALCAAETIAEPGDVYLDDPQHYALAAKFAKDWQGQMVDWQYPKQWLVMEGQLKREGDEAMSGQFEQAQLIIDWLRNEAEKRMGEARGRRDGNEGMRNATPSELRASVALAERMAGHKLTIDTSKKAAVDYADMQDRIAVKLDAEARKLSAWADMIAKLEEQLRAADSVLEAMKPNSVCPHDEEPDYCVCCETDRSKRIAEAANTYLALRNRAAAKE